MVVVDITEQEIQIIIAILKFSIVACPTDSISQDVDIDTDKLDKLVIKMEKCLK